MWIERADVNGRLARDTLKDSHKFTPQTHLTYPSSAPCHTRRMGMTRKTRQEIEAILRLLLPG